MSHFESAIEPEVCPESIGYFRAAWQDRSDKTALEVTRGDLTICEADGQLTLRQGDTPTLSVRIHRNTPSNERNPDVTIRGCTTEQVNAAIGILMGRTHS